MSSLRQEGDLPTVSSAPLREYQTVAHLVSALAGICAASPSQVVTKLTNVLWDDQEASELQKILGTMQGAQA